MKRKAVWALSLLLSAQASSATEPGRDSLHFTMERYPGFFGEYCLDMKEGETLDVTVNSPHPVKVNLHYHDGTEEAQYLLDEVKDNTSPSSVTITADGEYCLQITNYEVRPSRFELTLDYEVSAPAANFAT